MSLSATSWFGGATSRRARLKWSGRWSSIRVRPTSWRFPPGLCPSWAGPNKARRNATRLTVSIPRRRHSIQRFAIENYFFTKRYRESAEATKRHDAWLGAHVLDFLVFRAAAQIEAGAADDAAATIAEWKQKYPQAPVEEYMSDYTAYSRQQEADQLVASLRKAGAPMCVPGEKLADVPKLQRLKLCDEERAKQSAR